MTASLNTGGSSAAVFTSWSDAKRLLSADCPACDTPRHRRHVHLASMAPLGFDITRNTSKDLNMFGYQAIASRCRPRRVPGVAVTAVLLRGWRCRPTSPVRSS